MSRHSCVDAPKPETLHALREIERHLESSRELLGCLDRDEMYRASALANVFYESTRNAIANFSASERNSLPVALMKASDVVEHKLIGLSQPTLYRAAQQNRFYSVTPPGRTNGALYPTWQFVSPVPELIEEILKKLASLPSSEIHAFWTTASDDFNELAPAEMLAGKPFETRPTLELSQSRFLDLPTNSRFNKVKEQAQMFAEGMTDI